MNSNPHPRPLSLRARGAAQSGQAVILMAVVIALLFALFTLVFEVGRLLVARESIISASRRAGEAGLSYMVDYAERRSDWNETVLRARRNIQVWQTFYEETTGIPRWVRQKSLRYLQLNLQEHLNLVTQRSIDDLTTTVFEFPYKEPNWPTATIGVRVTVTVQVPLLLLGQLGGATVPLTVQTVSITSVDELLGISSGANPVFGAGGSATELTRTNGLRGSTGGWVAPFVGFSENVVTQDYGCPKDFTSAYAYAAGRHVGIDMGIPEGTNLFAVNDATVYYVGPYPNVADPSVAAQVVILNTDDNYLVTYMHVLSYTVKKGDRVRAGDLIGVSDGDPKKHPPSFTGYTTAAHLHFQVGKAAATGGFPYDFPNDKDPSPLLGLGAEGTHSRPPQGPNGQCFAPPPPPPKK